MNVRLNNIVDWAKGFMDTMAKKLQPPKLETPNTKKDTHHGLMDTIGSYHEEIIPSHASIPQKPFPHLTADKVEPNHLDLEEGLEILNQHSTGIEEEFINKPASVLENTIKKISDEIDVELNKPNRDFNKLQELVYKVVAGLMHKAKKVDQEYITEAGAEIRVQAVKVQGTYNTWPALVITLVASGVSIVGGAAGLSPFAPAAWISVESAKTLAYASQSIGTAGTGLSGVSSIFNSKGEGTRFVYQILLEEVKKKREDREGRKQQHSNVKSEMIRNLGESNSEKHRTVSTILGN